MDAKTGNIYEVKSDDEQQRIEKALGRKLVQLTDEEATELRGMNRRERRKWAALKRSEEHNARKRERRARV